MASQRIFPKYRIEKRRDMTGRVYKTQIFDVDNGHELIGVQKVKLDLEAGQPARIQFTVFADEVEVVII